MATAASKQAVEKAEEVKPAETVEVPDKTSDELVKKFLRGEAVPEGTVITRGAGNKLVAKKAK